MKEPMNQVDPTNGQIATDVASLTNEYKELDCAINDLTTELLEQHHKLAGRIEHELMPLLNRMQMLLSQRGELHALTSADRSLVGEVDQLEELPTWTEWFEAIRSRIEMAMSLRTVQRKLKMLREKTEQVTDDIDDADESEADEPSAPATATERDEVKSSAELLTEHTNEMMDVLAGRSIMSDSMRITRCTRRSKNRPRDAALAA